MELLPRHPNYYKKILLFSAPHIRKMSSLSIKERKMKFNELSNDLNIKLIKGIKNSILYLKGHINNGIALKIKPIDLSIKN